MRILMAGVSRTVRGGAETYQRSIISALCSAGHEVAFLHELTSADGQPTLDGEAPGLSRWCVAKGGLATALQNVAAWRPDVAYVHGLNSPLLETALLNQFPAVLYAHGYYGTCPAGFKRHAFPEIAMCSRTIGTTCLLLHYPRRCGGLNPATAFAGYRREQQRHRLLFRYRTILVASRHMYQEYRRHGIPDDRVQLAPLFPSGPVPETEPPLVAQGTGRVLLMGRITAVKGGAVLIPALRSAGQALNRVLHLTVGGDGPEVDALRELARREGVDAEFLGWLGTGELGALYRSAELLAVPSLWPEPFGLVGIEAGSVGLPAVAFAVGGIPDWLIPGVSGECATGKRLTVAALSGAIVRALRDPDHYAALRRGAWQTACRFTLDGHLNVLARVLNRAAGEGACR